MNCFVSQKPPRRSAVRAKFPPVVFAKCNFVAC
jgi:hypothetical protein